MLIFKTKGLKGKRIFPFCAKAPRTALNRESCAHF